MKQWLKKTAAGLTAAAALCGGMLPAVPEGLQLLAPALTASAESVTTAIAPGVVYRSGDYIDFGSGAYVDLGEYSVVYELSGTRKVTYDGFHSEEGDDFYQFNIEDLDVFSIQIASKNLGTPEGFRVSGGDGTKDNPYTLAIVLATETAPELFFSVGDVFNLGDKINFGSGCYIQTDDFGEGDVQKVSGSMKLSYAQFSDAYNQYEFKLDGTVMLWISSENLGEPSGLRIKGGNGTESNPITFAPVLPELSFSVGDVFMLDSKIDFGTGCYILSDDSGDGFVQKAAGSMKLTYADYFDTLSQYEFKLDGTVTLWISSENLGEPTGVRIKGGNGTESNPITFAPVLPEPEPELFFSVGDVFNLGDKINFGSGCYIQTDDFGEGEVEKVSGSMKLTIADYSVIYSQYEFKLDGTVTLWISSEDLGVPVGVRIKGGNGTQSNPITFAPVLPEPEPELSFSVGDVFMLESKIDFGSGCYILSDDSGDGYVRKAAGSMKLTYDDYSDTYSQYEFKLDGTMTLWLCSENLGVPVGVKVKSGNGTQSNPIAFAPVTSLALTAENITLADTVLPYTGKKVKPAVTVTVGGSVLTEGVDYTLGYSSNVNLGYRTAKAVITGIGAYTGTVRVPFSIVPAQQAAPAIAFDGSKMTVSWAADANATGYKVTVSKSSTLNAAAKSTQTQTVTGTSATFTGMAEGETWYAAVTAYVTNEKAGITGEIAKQKLVAVQPITKAVFASGAVEYAYTGAKITPAMTVKCGTTVLTEGVDYTVTYKKNKAVGYKTATATVTGIGNYSGSITKKFTIVPAQQAAPAVKATNSGKLWVKWAEDASAIGYEVVISKSSSLNPAAKSTVFTVFAPGTVSNSFAQPASGETWYVAVRSVISDDGTTSGTLCGSFSETVKIKMP